MNNIYVQCTDQANDSHGCERDNGTERIRTVKHSAPRVRRIVVDLNLPSLRISPYASRCPRKVVADSHSGGDIRISGNVVLVIDDRSHRVKPSAATTVNDIA